MANFWDWYYENGIIPNLWRGFTGQKSADMQNDANLAFQRENLEWQKQLQQQIFEREDTAYERAVSDAQRVGLNPMSIASSGGAGSGSVVPTTPLHSDVDYSQFSGLRGMESLTSALGVASQASQAINEFKTGNIQRDLLRTQEERAKMDNAIYAYENGLDVDDDGNIYVTADSPLRRREIQEAEKNNREASTENTKVNTAGKKIENKRNQRVLDYQERTNTNDSTPEKVNIPLSALDVLTTPHDKNSGKSSQDDLTEYYTEKESNNTLRSFWNNVRKIRDDMEKMQKRQIRKNSGLNKN